MMNLILLYFVLQNIQAVDMKGKPLFQLVLLQ